MGNHETKRENNRELMMLNDPIPGVVIKMAIPTIVAFLITSIYNMADTYFVSSLGTNATAAVSVNASLDQFIMMAGSMLAVGANSYIARLLGEHKRERATHVLSTSFFIAFALGFLILVFGTIFMGPMVRVLGATDTCEEYSVQYARYVLLVAPFMATSFVMNQCLRAEGSAMLSMIGMGFGGILNCILDPIFIFGLDLGVTGASIATAISKFISFAILIFPYITRRSVLRISLSCFRWEKTILYQVASVGSASMFRSGLAVVSAIVLNNIAGDISDSVLAGIGVSTKVMMFPFSIILGFCSGFQPVAGFNWGAKRYDRVLECYRFASWTTLIGAAVMGIAGSLAANPIVALFAKDDVGMLEIGALTIILQCLALPIQGWVAVVNMFCAGLGDAKGALILSTSRQGSCFFPVVYPLSYIWGANGVAAVQTVADVLSLLLAVPIIRKVLKRVRKAMEEYQAEQAVLDVDS